jgi:large subunit ribosomal protein L13Ae
MCVWLADPFFSLSLSLSLFAFLFYRSQSTNKTIVVVDAKGHMLGRLASTVAKQLLQGQHVVVVRTEGICLSGGMVRRKQRWDYYRKKRMNTNPKKGPYHFTQPSRMFWRVVRGMLPHKTTRGKAAFERLKCFEGIPAPYDKVKRAVVPEALKIARLNEGRRFCVLGDLCSQIGWKHSETVKVLEAKRAEAGKDYWEKKKVATAKFEAAKKAANEQLGDLKELIERTGY